MEARWKGQMWGEGEGGETNQNNHVYLAYY